MKKVVIVSAARTPIGSFNGALASVPAPRLGARVIEECVSRAKLSKEIVNEVIMGNVLAAGEGQAPARQASIFAGLPSSVECMTINKVCGSGLKSVMLGAQAIINGDADVIVAGGMESMSNVPYILDKARNGYRMGHGELTDVLLRDGLIDVYTQNHMGIAAELCAKEFSLSRKDQDDFAVMSYRRAQEAQGNGFFTAEITAVKIPQKGKDDLIVDKDEEPGKTNFEKIPALKPAFAKDGTVTAANASKINDGAAAVVLMSEEKAKELGIEPMAAIIGFASFAQAPEWFTTAPVDAIKKVLRKTGMELSSIDLFEINEAFAVVTLAAMKLLNLSPEKVNVHGGAVALGHPIGASGCRILVTLIHALRQRGLARGLASICIGGGEAASMIIERPTK